MAKKASLIAYIGLVFTGTMAMAAFLILILNWFVIESEDFLKQIVIEANSGIMGSEPGDASVTIIYPTPTPRIATPVLGSPECEVGMVCVRPTQQPDDCKEDGYGSVCTYRGFTGSTEPETEQVVSVPMPVH